MTSTSGEKPAWSERPLLADCVDPPLWNGPRERSEALIHSGRSVIQGGFAANEVLSGGTIVGDVAGQTVLIVDDLCATGETLIRAAKACHAAGAGAIHIAVIHTPVAAGIQAVEALDCVSGVVVTDSTGFTAANPGTPTNPSKRTTLPIAPLLGQATRRLLAGKPLSPLLERWPVSFED